jgi:hypothetical protein
VNVRSTQLSVSRLLGPQDGGLRRSSSATAGSVVNVDVGPNDSSISVTDNSTGSTTTGPVSPGKTTPVTIPNAPVGTVILIEIGDGLNRRVLAVEIIGTGP